MSVAVFLCGAAGEDLETLGMVDARDDAPGRDAGCCDHCGEPLELEEDPYAQACGYCGRAIYGGAS